MPTTPSTQTSSLAAKILAVMGDIGELKKDKKNDHFNYQYASDELIVGAIRNALIKNKLAILPNQKSCTEILSKTSKGQDQIITKLEMEFELLDAETGESKIKTFFGYGADQGDKGVYKAATGCEKYFLMKTFLIATPDDPEFEKTQREARATYAGRVQTQNPRPPAPPPVTQSNATPAPRPATPAPANAAPANAAPANAAPANATAPSTPQPKSSSRTPQQTVHGYVDDIKQITPKSGDKFYRVVDTEGSAYATWSETLATSAKELRDKGVPVIFTVRFEPRGPVLDGIIAA